MSKESNLSVGVQNIIYTLYQFKYICVFMNMNLAGRNSLMDVNQNSSLFFGSLKKHLLTLLPVNTTFTLI